MKESKIKYQRHENVIFAFEEIKPVQYLTIWDFLLTPIYFLILTAIAKRMRDKRYPLGHPLREYFMKGLYVKFGGAIFIALVYQYYYGGGDTFNYFTHTKIINSSLQDSFTTWFKLITRQSVETNPELYPYVSQMEWYRDPASYSVAAIAAVFGLFTGTTYLPIALFFAFFSFTGVWAMYRTFANLYPKIYKELAIAFLFIPSTFVWGSAIFKDTVCMFGLGWLTYTTFRIFIYADFSVKNVTLLILSFFSIFLIKIYILLGFMPALSIWLLTIYSSRIQSTALRFLTRIAFIGIAIVGFLFFTRLFAQELQRYSLDNIAKTAETTRQWIYYVSGRDEGSAYDLGEFDPSIGGMIKKFPQAVVVTLFRPFPWEARKVIVFLSAIEAVLFAYFTFKAFRKRGVLNTFKLIAKDPNLLFCLIFSLIFAFAVGISSYNFGSLSRYKIPCLPFYGAFLMIILNYDKLAQRNPIPQLKRSTKAPALA
ncbi:hypothetical protein [Flavisolibacter tropicus]|uniref:hypothetical protein n=1 Tax=Flavisolibacter tropicus TaxID=1492898 RepID=UPI0008354B1C|nr:hypothetical protein [Flavisolibacter tropicus]